MAKEKTKDALLDIQRENHQLKETINALRVELEKAHMENAERLSEVETRANDEAAQLKNTVRALRDELSSFMIAHAERLEGATVGFTSENEELKQTIKELRGLLKKDG
jgi:hypothetical protein